MISKLIIKICVIPLVASFCGGVAEVRNTMREQNLDDFVVEEQPPSFPPPEELSVVEKIEPKEKEPKESIEDMIKRIFPEDWQLATAIFKAESGLRADAKGDTNTPYPSIGIAQIRMLPERELDEEWLKVPENNLLYARHLKDLHSWKPWSAFTSGKYKLFIK